MFSLPVKMILLGKPKHSYYPKCELLSHLFPAWLAGFEFSRSHLVNDEHLDSAGRALDEAP